MTTPREIAETLGYGQIAAAVGVGLTAVSNAVSRDRFPATWFIVVSKLCRERGMDCPPEAFGMKPAPAHGAAE
jgi:hypothetical protein